MKPYYNLDVSRFRRLHPVFSYPCIPAGLMLYFARRRATNSILFDCCNGPQQSGHFKIRPNGFGICKTQARRLLCWGGRSRGTLDLGDCLRRISGGDSERTPRRRWNLAVGCKWGVGGRLHKEWAPFSCPTTHPKLTGWLAGWVDDCL